MEEISCGGIVFFETKSGKSRKFVLVQSRKNLHWGFPKGHKLDNEPKEEAALREMREEIGIKNLEIITGFKEKLKYTLSDGNYKTTIFFLFKTGEKELKPDDDCKDVELLSYKEASGKLTFPDAKELLKKAAVFLDKKNRKNKF